MHQNCLKVGSDEDNRNDIARKAMKKTRTQGKSHGNFFIIKNICKFFHDENYFYFVAINPNFCRFPLGSSKVVV